MRCLRLDLAHAILILSRTADQMQELARQPKAPEVGMVLCDQQMKGMELLTLVVLMSLWSRASKQGTRN